MIDARQFASWVSAGARAAFEEGLPPPPPSATIEDLRRHYDAYNRRMLDTALARYAVAIEERACGGVPSHVVIPRAGLRSWRALLCLHGGAFMWGSGAGALLEAVPMAATMGCEVVAVDYRLAPENPYPAAIEDALAVYADLLTRAEASSIGIYGCSAGGMLTAQAIARLIAADGPLPGAVAMLHGTGLEFEGDLAAAAPAFSGQAGEGRVPRASELPYFATVDPHDPLVMPGEDPAALARFPPSLLITATRDFAASACSVMHRRLLAAGRISRFVLFDGLGHAHHMAVDVPESRETFEILRGFFDEHLTP